VAGIEIDPLAVAGPVRSAIIEAGKSRKHPGSSIWYFDDANLVIVLRDGLKGNVAAVGRPAGSSGLSVEGSQLRAIGSIAVAHPNIATAHAVRFEDDLLANRENSWAAARLLCLRGGAQGEPEYGARP
jgi:hypothetical protein